MMTNQAQLSSKILDSKNNGLLLGCIHDFYIKNFDEKQELFSILAELHNSKKIDLFEEFIELKNEPGKRDFWMTRHILEDTLTMLDIKSIPEALKCIEHLIKQGGSDMASHSILVKFQQKLESDEGLLEQVLEVFQEQPELYKDFLGSIITIGAKTDFDRFFELNFTLLDSNDKEIKCRAAYLLGQLNYPDKATMITSVEKLRLLGETESDDTILANIVHSYLTLLFKNPNLLDNKSEDFLNNILAKSGKFTFQSISTVLFHNKKDQENSDLSYFELIRKIYKYLQTPLAAEKGTIHYIGMAFPLQNQAELLKDYLELLEFHVENGIGIELFGINHYLEDNDELLEKVITRWLSMNSSRIPFSTRNFFVINDNRMLKPNFALVNMNFDGLNVFVARKAIGYLLAYPELLLSFLIHLMELSNEVEATNIANMIFHFILLNHTNLKENIVKLNSNLNTHNQLELTRIVKEIESYLQAIKSIPVLKELRPPIENIIEHNKSQAETMAKGLEDSNEKSLFRELFTPVTMLYGHKAIFKQQSNEHITRTEVPMISHSVSLEMPRMLFIDKDQLEYELVICRAERYNNEAHS